MHTLTVRPGSRRAVVVLAVLLATLLMVEKPARAQAIPEPVVNAAGQVYGFLTQSAAGGSQMISQWDGRYFEVLHKWEQATGGWLPGVKHTVGNVMQNMRAAVQPAYPYLARVGIGSAATASAASTVAAAGGVGVALPAAVVGAVATGTGVLIGWGAVEAGVWTWAGCEHWLNTGNGRCEADPVPATPGDEGVSNGVTFTPRWDGSWYQMDHSAIPQLPDNHTLYMYYECPPQKFQAGNYPDRPWDFRIYQSLEPEGTRQLSGACNPGQGEQVSVIGTIVSSGTPEGVHDNGGMPSDHEGFDAWVPTGGGAAPDRRVVTEATCINPDDQWTVVVNAESDPYVVGDEMITPRVDCPAGYPVVASANITREVDGQPEASEALFTYEAPEALTDPDPSDPLTAAGCYQGECDLVLHKGDETGPDCDDGDVVCLGWWDQMTNGTGDYTCTWGGVVVPWTDCEPFANVDNNNAPQAGENPAGPNPSAPPGTSSNPAHVEDGCDAGGGSWWNPFDNIAGGVACALEWAFVPGPEALAEVQAQIETANESLGGKVGIADLNAMDAWAGGFAADLPEGTPGCWEAVLDVSMLPGDQSSLTVIDTCPADPVVSWFHGNRGMLEGFLYGAMIVPLLWWAWRQAMPVIGGGNAP